MPATTCSLIRNKPRQPGVHCLGDTSKATLHWGYVHVLLPVQAMLSARPTPPRKCTSNGLITSHDSSQHIHVPWYHTVCGDCFNQTKKTSKDECQLTASDQDAHKVAQQQIVKES
eukprot:scpid65113/ scgid22838/ 